MSELLTVCPSLSSFRCPSTSKIHQHPPDGEQSPMIKLELHQMPSLIQMQCRRAMEMTEATLNQTVGLENRLYYG